MKTLLRLSLYPYIGFRYLLLLALAVGVAPAFGQYPGIISRSTALPINVCESTHFYATDQFLQNNYTVNDVNGTPAPDVWFTFSLNAPSNISFKACYGASPTATTDGQRLSLHLLRATLGAPFYTHVATDAGTGVSTCARVPSPDYPELTLPGLGIGTYYIVVEAEEMGTWMANTDISFDLTMAPGADGVQPEVHIDPAFAVLQPNETLTLNATGNVCAYQWVQNPHLTGSLTGLQVQVAPLSQTVYTLNGLDENGAVVATASATISIEGGALTHIITRTPREAFSDITELPDARPGDCATATTYFDGFGQPIQTVAQQASPLLLDLVTATEYDAFGHPVKQFLPYATPHANRTGFDGFRADYATAQPNFYRANGDKISNDEAPFKTTWFDLGGPNARPTVQAGAGLAWQPAPDGTGGHAVRLAYETNTDAIGTDKRARRFVYNFATAQVEVGSPAYYPAGTLALALTTDENGHPHRLFTDSEGREILRQTPLDSLHQTWASTYTVYDAFGRKCLILPPMAVEALDNGGALTPALIHKWAYRYVYDARGRLLEKHLPGPVPTYYVYNERDQPVLIGDATGRWLFSKFDALGRPVLSGEYTAAHGAPRAALQQDADAATANGQALYELPTGSPPAPYDSTSAGSLTWTLTHAWPTNVADSDLRTRTFYDRTDWAPLRASGHRFVGEDVEARDLDPTDADHPPFKLIHADLVASNHLLGLVTGTQERVLGVDGPVSLDWLTTTTTFDARLRPVQTRTDVTDAVGTVSGQERTSQRLSWRGAVEQTLTRHPVQGVAPGDPDADLRLYQYTRYDVGGRLVSTLHRVNQQPPVVLAQAQYNALGELVDKRLHSPDGGAHAAQSVDFRYAIRGWLTHVNDRHLGAAEGLTASVWAAGVDQPQDNPSTDGPDLLGLEFTYATGLLLTAAVGSQPQWTGNIAEQHWRTHTQRTDGAARAFAYRYDAADRLVAAPFRTRLDANSTQSPTQVPAWNGPGGSGGPAPNGVFLPDFSVSGLQYDANGNLKRLKRQGVAAATVSKTLDDLTFTYDGNRLIATEDAADTTPDVAHDFDDHGAHYDKITHPTSEYAYDTQGNRSQDVARGLTLRYNALNLTADITNAAGASLSNRYTASGRKLAALTTDAAANGGAGTLAATVFSGGAGVVYEDRNDGSGLHPAWVPTAEGRLVWRPEAAPDARWAYEYHLRDHLGNLRVAFQPLGLEGTEWSDSFEPGGGGSGQRTAKGTPKGTPKTTLPTDTTRLRVRGVAATRAYLPQRARTGSHVIRLGGTGAHARAVGPVVRVPIAAGDSVFADVWASYDLPLRVGFAGFPAVPALASTPEATPTGTRTRLFPQIKLHLASVFATQSAPPPTAPAAYLKVALYTADSVLLDEKRAYLSDSLPAGDWQFLQTKLAADSSGYVEVSLHEENAATAYFDDLAIRILEKQIQENHYDPWGMNLVGIENDGNPTHQFQFNGKEKIDALNLFVNDHGARLLNLQDVPQWLAMDPLAEKYADTSPYAFVKNNPIRFKDPDGREVVDAEGHTVTVRKIKDGDNNVIGLQYGFVKGTTEKTKKEFALNGQVLLNSLIGTSTGLAQIDKALREGVRIHFNLIDGKGPFDKARNQNASGLTDRITKNGKIDRSAVMQISVFKQTIFDNNPTDWSNPQKWIPIHQLQAEVTGHETEHTTEKNMRLADQGKDAETEPEQIADKIRGQFLRKTKR